MVLEKITDSRNGPSRRRYDDACGTAHALDLIGERWALLVLRELMLGPKRFSDIRADLPGISAKTFLVTIADGRMEAERGAVAGAGLVFTGPAPAIAGAVYGGVPIAALEAEGALQVEGDRALAARFVTLFPLPPKAGV